MRKLGRYSALILAAAALVSLAGCGDVKFEPKESSVYVDTDGSVIGAEIESFDNSGFEQERYKAEDLQTLVETQVKAYNKDSGSSEVAYARDLTDKKASLPVAIQKLEVKDAEATLLLDYATCSDYLSFNRNEGQLKELTMTSAPQAAGAGINLDSLVTEDGSPADVEAAKGDQDYTLLSVCGTTTVVVNGDVIGVTEGYSILDDNTVSVSGDRVGYILFKNK